MNLQYDSCAPLHSPPPYLDKQIGVAVTTEYHHIDAPGATVEIFIQFPVLNTQTTGEWAPPDGWLPYAIAGTRLILTHIERLIAELNAHHDRMTDHLVNLQTDAANSTA